MSTNPTLPEELLDIVQLCILNIENRQLMAIPYADEIKRRVWSLHPLKSPKSNDLLGVFCCTYQATIKGQIIHCLHECFKEEPMPIGLNQMLLVLIPKVRDCSVFNHYQSISLYKFIYKIVSKILSNRMRRFLSRIISTNQGTFIEMDS